MRKELLVAALGFLIGAASLAGGQDDDSDLLDRLDELQEQVDRARLQVPPGQDVQVLASPGFRIFPVFDLTAGAPHFQPPDLVFDEGNSPEREETPEGDRRLPVGTVEEVMELVRCSVRPFAWEQDGWITATGQTLLAGSNRAVLEDVATFLDGKIRDAAHRCVTVEAQAVDMTDDLYRALASGTSTSLAPEQARALDDALAAGTARRVFQVRATGFAGQRFVARHGRQVAIVGRADAVVSKGAGDLDPRVEAVRTGGYLAVLASVGDDPARITLDVDMCHVALEELVTKPAGTLAFDAPRLVGCRARTSLTVPNRTWAIVGGGTRLAEGVRILLVRATYLPRSKGGAK